MARFSRPVRRRAGWEGGVAVEGSGAASILCSAQGFGGGMWHGRTRTLGYASLRDAGGTF